MLIGSAHLFLRLAKKSSKKITMVDDFARKNFAAAGKKDSIEVAITADDLSLKPNATIRRK